ncbi:MAG: hypothetical protein ABSE73_17735 [Planctomycetota bacterium]
MDPVALLHNAVRSFCIDGIAKWRARCADLCNAGLIQVAKSHDGWQGATDDAFRVFPRHIVLNAILHEVEGFAATDFHSLDEARTYLCLAGDTAEDDFSRFENKIAREAIAEERSAFRQFVATVSIEQCARIPVLPFKRVLTKTEHLHFAMAFAAKWGHWYGGYTDLPGAPENVTLHVVAMKAPDAYLNLQRAMVGRGISRILELREWGDGYELDVALVGFTYTGAEGFWTVDDMGWMVYASHEASITFGGSWLIQHMRASLPEFDRYIYRERDIKAYAQ